MIKFKTNAIKFRKIRLNGYFMKMPLASNVALGKKSGQFSDLQTMGTKRL